MYKRLKYSTRFILILSLVLVGAIITKNRYFLYGFFLKYDSHVGERAQTQDNIASSSGEGESNDTLSEAASDKSLAGQEGGTCVEGEILGLDTYIEILRNFGAELDLERKPLDSPSGRFQNITLGSEFVAVEMKTGLLSRYVFSGMEEKGTKDLSISEEFAMSRANALLRALGIEEFNTEKVKVVYNSRQWTMTQLPEIDGIPGGGILQISISGVSGRLRSFNYAPQSIPNSREVKISSDEAIGIAKRAMGLGWYLEPVRSTKPMIVNPNNAFDRDEHTRFKADEETRVCWVVVLGRTGREGSTFSAVFVDASTGAVAGGFW